MYSGEKANNTNSGRIILDPTMNELVDLVQSMEGNKGIEGRLYIYNLFPLQNASKDSAILEFNQLWTQNESLVRGLPEEKDGLVKQLIECPWVLIGWGCGNNSEEIRFLKTEWLSVIEEAGIPKLGKRGKTEWDYYHPRPRLNSELILYKQEILRQYSHLLKQNKENVRSAPTLLADESWMRHFQRLENIVGEIICGQYILLFLDIDENDERYVINYRYRILCFLEDRSYPVLSINYEWSKMGTICLGAHFECEHINLGQAPPELRFNDFIEWAAKILPRYIKDLDVDLLENKISAFSEDLKQRREQLDEGPISENIISPERLLTKRVEKINNNLREYEDRFEYCFISEYEEKFKRFEVHSVQLGDVYPVVLECIYTYCFLHRL